MRTGFASMRSMRREIELTVAAVSNVASVIRRIGGRKSHPEFHRVHANTLRLGIPSGRATTQHLARAHHFGRQPV
jgi:hypothetical protein